MLIKYSENHGLCGWFILFSLLCVLVFRVSTYGLESSDGMKNSQEKICFFWEEDENGMEVGRRILYLYASPALRITAGEEDFAVLLNFSLRKGWEVQSVQGICEGSKLNCTVGNGCILLDGVLEGGDISAEREPVCLLVMEAVAENHSVEVFPFDIQWNRGEKDLLYVRGKDKHIDSYSFWYGENSLFYDETVTPSSEQTFSEPIVSGKEEINTMESEMYPSETSGSISDKPEAGIHDPVTYLGCQETPVRDGYYSVRFLFYGSSCPSIQVQGGGVLYETVTHPDRVDMWKDGNEYFFYPDHKKDITVCTFRGLMDSREYKFLIQTENSDIMIMYTYGKYREN